jgi:diacylglycerol kinase (ATP)
LVIRISVSDFGMTVASLCSAIEIRFTSEQGEVMKWLAILNPMAHNGVGVNHLRSLARLLHQELGAECAWTTYPRHARDIARRSREFDGLIAVGGDGTIYEVINGMDVTSQCLGIVPAGTGNGLAHELNIRHLFSALHPLRQPRFAPIDLIQVRFRAGSRWHQRYVGHTSAIGYIAELVALALGPLKPLDYLRYAVAGCVQACRQKPFRLRIRIDDRDERECVLTNLTINNTRYAGPFCLFPEASVQDGRLNLLYGRNLPRDQLLEDAGILTQLYFWEQSRRCPAQDVSVDLAAPMTLMLDGELIPQVDAVRFAVVKSCLRCVAARGSKLKLLDEEQALSPLAEDAAAGRQLAPC